MEKEIAELLFEKKAVRFYFDNLVTWSSGIKAPVYCDNRLLISDVEARAKVLRGFQEIFKKNNYKVEAIAGTATAGIPWAAWLAQELNLPMIYVRGEKKNHGLGKQIEGKIEAGTSVILIEDLISTGGSALNGVAALKEEGKLKVIAVVAIVTYELEESKLAFKEADVSLTTLTSLKQIAEVAQKRAEISENDYQRLLQFQSDPWNW